MAPLTATMSSTLTQSSNADVLNALLATKALGKVISSAVVLLERFIAMIVHLNSPDGRAKARALTALGSPETACLTAPGGMNQVKCLKRK